MTGKKNGGKDRKWKAGEGLVQAKGNKAPSKAHCFAILSQFNLSGNFGNVEKEYVVVIEVFLHFYFLFGEVTRQRSPGGYRFQSRLGLAHDCCASANRR